MAELKDSGARKEFSTGAVRDISEGKGRCDLLPLDVIDRVLNVYEQRLANKTVPNPDHTVLSLVDGYICNGDDGYLVAAIFHFIDEAFLKDPYTAIIELSKHYEDGAKKYSDNNWKLGIDLHCFIDSAVRHYLKYLRGDNDEPHDRAVLWNLIGAIWTHKHKPEMNDIHLCERDLSFLRKKLNVAEQKCTVDEMEDWVKANPNFYGVTFEIDKFREQFRKKHNREPTSNEIRVGYGFPPITDEYLLKKGYIYQSEGETNEKD